MQHGWLGKPSHPFYVPALYAWAGLRLGRRRWQQISALHPTLAAQVPSPAASAVQSGKAGGRQFRYLHWRRRQQHKQVKRPALSVIKSSGPHLHPKSSVAYENTRLNYREGTILPVFVCVYLYLPVFACICLHPHLCLLHICRLDAAVGGRSQTRIAGHPGGARRNHQLS